MTELIKISAYIGVFYAYLISGNPIFLTALSVAAILESFSKIRLDIRQDKFTFKRSLCIIFSKMWYLALIIISTQLDYIFIELGMSQKKITVTNGTVLGLFVYDALRFIKNLKQFGIPVPDFLLNVLKKLTDSINKG